MNKMYCLIIVFITCRVSIAQNLVPNGDFEQYSGCPTAGGGVFLGQLDSTLFWINPAPFPPGGSPEYFNQCSVGNLNVPNNYFGFQQANSGVAYCGIVLWTSSIPDFREYIEAPLATSLTANTCYHFEMFISASHIMQYATDNIQIYFSDTAITGINNWNVLPYIPQILNGSGNIPDTLNWTLVSGDYVASGGEQYLLIGNFNNDASTNTTLINNMALSPYAYIYIDDVSLIQVPPCSNVINTKDNNEGVNIFPNPFSNELNIDCSSNQLFEIILYDIALRKLRQQKFTGSISLNTEQLVKGIYLYEVRNKNGVINKGKIVKD